MKNRYLNILDSNGNKIGESSVLEAENAKELFGNSAIGKMLEKLNINYIKLIIDNNYPYNQISYKIYFLGPAIISNHDMDDYDLKIDAIGPYSKQNSQLFLKYVASKLEIKNNPVNFIENDIEVLKIKNTLFHFDEKIEITDPNLIQSLFKPKIGNISINTLDKVILNFNRDWQMVPNIILKFERNGKIMSFKDVTGEEISSDKDFEYEIGGHPHSRETDVVLFLEKMIKE